VTPAAQVLEELDSIQCPHARARRLAEYLRGWMTCWPDTWDVRGYRMTLENAAGDLVGDAEQLEAQRADAEAASEYFERRHYERGEMV
jgi:hypothetical protein